MEHAQSLAVGHHGNAHVVWQRGVTHMLAERPTGIIVNQMHLSCLQRPTVVKRESPFFPNGAGPGSYRLYGFLPRSDASDEKGSFLRGKKLASKFGDYSVGFIGGNGCLEKIPFLEEKIDLA